MKKFVNYITENINHLSFLFEEIKELPQSLLDKIEKCDNDNKKRNLLRNYLKDISPEVRANSYNNRSKHPLEILRGNFGEDFDSGLKNFLDKAKLTDYKITEPDSDDIVSGQFKSLKVNWNGFSFIVVNYNNSSKNKNNNYIKVSKEELSPVKLGICNKDYYNINSLIKDLENKIKDKEVASFIKRLLEEIDKEKFKGNDGSFIFKSSDNDLIETWKNFSKETRNNIQVAFGEVICGVCALTIYDKDYDHIFFPNDSSNFFSDFYLGFKGETSPEHKIAGCSVKSGSSSKGRKPSLKVLFKKLVDNKDLIYNELKKNKNFKEEELNKFKEISNLFIKADESGKEPQTYNIIWNLTKKLNEISNNEYVSKIIKDYGNFDSEKELNNELIKLSSDGVTNLFKTLNGIINKPRVEKNIDKNKHWLYNTSKVMVYLVLWCIDELNNLFDNKGESKSYFNEIVNIYLNQKKQFIINISLNENLVINIDLQEAKSVKIVFENEGVTSNDWKNHGTIGFKFI